MPISRVQVRDHKAFGKKVVEWATNPASRPTSLEDLKQECEDILVIPSRIKGLCWVEMDLNTLVIRVPNRDMVKESVERFTGPQAGRKYPMPAFYETEQALNKPSSLDLLYSRIADYTIAQCV